MRPAHQSPNMYGQRTCVVPQNPNVQYYTTNLPPGNPPPLLQQYVQRNPNLHDPSQPLPQPQLQPQLQPVYLVQQQAVMHQYPAVVGVPTQVMGNPVPQALAVQGVSQGVPQGVPAYGAPGWAYRPAMVEQPPSNAPVWGYSNGASRGYGQQPQQQPEPRGGVNWQRGAPQGYGGNGVGAGGGGGFQGRVEGHGNGAGGGGGFQGRGESHGNGVGGFQGRGDSHGNGVGGPGGFQGRAESHGNAQSFGKTGGEGRRPERGFESSSESRHYSSGGPGRQQMNRQAAPPQSPAPSQAKQLSCEACEKTFAVHSQYTAHMNTHVQCDEIGCSFSASGKVVKEHKLTSHSKSSNPNPMSALKATSNLSEESSDEIKAWREERKRNYPTRLNIQRKKEVLEGKVARGELVEEDARKRRQRMKEILAKQAELGVPVAEVPAYYLSHKEDKARGRKNLDHSPTADSKKRKIGEDANITTNMEEQPSKSARVDTDLAEVDPEMKVMAQAEDRNEAGTSQPLDKPAKSQCFFYQRGRCKKGPKCHFAHTRGKKGGEGEPGQGGRKTKEIIEKKRPPTLLSKLLQNDITRDKSYILQCLRFFVNNNFLLKGIVQPSQSTQLTVVSDAAEDSSDYSEGEVVEAPDMLLADTAIINTLLSEGPEVLAKVIEMET